MAAGAAPAAGTYTPTSPCGAAGGKVSRGVTTTLVESADSTAPASY